MSLSMRATLYLTAVGIIAYWITVFCGAFVVHELVPGYRHWFMSFPVADLWIAATSTLAAIVATSNRPLGAIAMAAAGSALIFLGLYAFAYGVNTGLVDNLTMDEVIEIIIKIYCLGTGAWFVLSAYRLASGPL